MEKSSTVSKIRGALENALHAVNPCDAPEESLRWRLACTLLPGDKYKSFALGAVYGVAISVSIVIVAWWVS